MSRVALALGVLLWCIGVTSAVAQSTPAAGPSWRAWRPVVSVGGGWLGTEALGTVTATTRAASVGTLSPSPFTLFETDSTLEASPRLELGIAVPVTPALAVEVVGSSARPTLSTAIGRDAENAPDTTSSERVDEYTVGARAIYQFRRWSLAERAWPYVAAGGAYLRQLHEEQVLVETGQVWTASAGLRIWLGGGVRRSRAVGLTAEAGWSWRSGGISFADGARSVPTASVRLFAGF